MAFQKMVILQIIVLFFSFPFLQQSHADDDLQNAIEETKKDLIDPKRRKEILQKSPDAQRADSLAGSVTGGGIYQEELYAISAELLPVVSQLANGDPAKMASLLAEAQKDPKSFLKKIPAEQREKIKKLTDKIEQSQKRP